ncbi:MAG: calcium/sodium antiporter [Sandaracinaceae bacterium]
MAVVSGFLVLLWSADRFVLGAAGVARNLGVSPLVIGLTVVGFGTSAPEFLVSGIAASFGSAHLCIGNAIGSNIANVALVLGASALVAPMLVRGTVLRRELPVLVGCMVLATLLMSDGTLGRVDGLILAVGLGAMMAWVTFLGLRTEDPSEVEAELPPPVPMRRSVVWLVMGLALLILSSRILVWGATSLARDLGVGELFIGLTVVALGTSLPELAASVMAARRGEHDLAVGNVVGSNMFNTLGVLALPGLIAPGPVPSYVLSRDLPVMFGVTFLFFLMTQFFRRPSVVSRWEGGLLVATFAVYVIVLHSTM